ncbi:AAA family ATPase [Nonomuraea sp. NPDC050790]|uniref:AAA family ATPase n=1 Tax=Nonomuraea sp. NPDC050790 TaxID=3364371 RepID=UPI0037B5B346
MMLGRTEERELIAAFLDQASSDGRALVLVGEPGIGKSTLLDAAAATASAAGRRVLRAEGVEFEAEGAFSGLNQALLPLSAEIRDPALAAALDLGRAHRPPPDLMAVAAATLSLVRQAEAVLVVDDLQWLDRSSAVVLSFVARRLSGSRAGFLGAARSETPGHFDHGALPTHELPRLDDEAAGELLRARYPLLAPRVRTRLMAEAQGNPLALLELAGSLRGRQAYPRATDHAARPPLHRVQALYASRVADLPPPTRTLLLLAVLDGTGDLGVLRAASGDDELLGLAPAERANLVQIDEDAPRLLFRHPLIRSGIMGASTARERRQARLALAEALADRPDRRAWHLAEAATGPDEVVAALLETVADTTLLRGDAPAAAAVLRRAAELSPQRAGRARRLSRAAYAERFAGDRRDLGLLLSEARRADPASGEALEAAVAAAYLLLTEQGDVDAAFHHLLGALDAGDAKGEVLADAYQTLLYICWFAGRPELWERYEAALDRPGLPQTLVRCTGFYADPARASAADLSWLDAEIGALCETGEPADVIRIADSAIFLDRLGGCRQALWQIVNEGRAGGGSTSTHTALIALAIDDFFSGQWAQADELLGELLSLSRVLGYRMVWPAQHVQALLVAARGDFDRARTLTDEIARWAESRGMHQARWYGRHARTLAALGEGDFEYAFLQAGAISPPGELARHVPLALWAAMDLVEAAVHTNRHAEAEAHVRAMREAGLAELSPRLAMTVTASAAMVAPDSRAWPLFERALAVPGADRRPFELARVNLAYGVRLRRAQSRAKAREHLTAALDTFQWLGAQPWAVRAGNEIRATGRTTSRGKAPSTRLTPQEHQIATLAAAGLTNKEIGERLRLSHRTVSSHLHRIYPKLGITTRTALNAVLPGA